MRLLRLSLFLLLFVTLAATWPAPGQEMARDGRSPSSAANSTHSWAQKLTQGGTTVIVQVLLSIFGGAYAIERAFRLRRRSVSPEGFAQRADTLWRSGQFTELGALCREQPSTLSRIITYIARHRDSPVADVSMIAGDIASREIALHMQRAYPLAVVATLEPLLGLLGTVLGMIESFDAIVQTGTMGDPALLAAGISKALITTAVGLMIAIPFLGLYHYFKSRTNFFASILEEEVTHLISEWLLSSRHESREDGYAHQTARG